MFRNRSVNIHQFSMVPKMAVPRSQFRIQSSHKTTFDAGKLIPVYVEEILPGDTFQVKMTAFARMATPIFPIMDNLWLESFFFFVAMRLVWTNFVKMMGEQTNPGDSISYTVPQMTSPAGGYAVGSLHDYFGLPTVGQVTAGMTVQHNALPLRCYNKIYNDWFRDQNLVLSFPVPMTDGPDTSSTYIVLSRGKRHDYFTACLPFLQKGPAATLPLGTSAPVITSSSFVAPQARGVEFRQIGTTTAAAGGVAAGFTNTPNVGSFAATNTVITTQGSVLYPANLFVDLTTATASTINQIRMSVLTQRFLELDARGGTRYTEYVRAHFGVASPDMRLQRAEYLGGGTTPVNIAPVAQTSNTPVSGTPQGNLAAFGTALAREHGFRQSFTEHGYVIGLVAVRADLTYQQGMRRLWSKLTRYDFYDPVFQGLGEQAVLNKEIYAVGSATGGMGAADQDMQVFGYIPRWDEYRYQPSLITGLFRSTAAGTLDPWHAAQRFTALPTLNSQFILEDPPLDRVIAVPSQPHFLFDSFFDVRAARPLPMHSVPGMGVNL